MATLAEFEEAIRRTQEAKAAFISLCDEGEIDYEMARVLMVNQNGITMGRATDEIAFLEAITGRTLKR